MNRFTGGISEDLAFTSLHPFTQAVDLVLTERPSLHSPNRLRSQIFIRVKCLRYRAVLIFPFANPPLNLHKIIPRGKLLLNEHQPSLAHPRAKLNITRQLLGGKLFLIFALRCF